jgi:hypothetical protein
VSTAFNMSQALGDNTQGPATQRVDGEKVASPPY